MHKILKNNSEFRLIIAYIQEKVTAVEREDVEDALKRDAFLREAKEGFTVIKVSDVMCDIAEIDSMLGNKKKHASSVYLLVFIAAVLIAFSVFLFKKYSNKQPVEIVESEMSFEEEIVDDSVFYDSEAIIPEIASDSSVVSDTVIVSDKKENTIDKVDKTKKNDKQIVKSDEPEPDNRISEKERPIANTDIVEKPEPEQADTSFQYVEDVPVLSQQEVNLEDFGSLNIEKDELGLAKTEISEAGTELVSPDYSAKAAPEGGFSKLDEFIYENLVYPETDERQRRQVIRISFIVGINGELRDFSVPRAPENEDFRKEAMRLIKKGPQWTPAFDNGMAVEEEVTIRIVFRP